MLPMGTIVTGCMLAGLLIALKLPILNKSPLALRKTIGWLVMAAGLWNTLWYGLQHLTEFWGYSALVSGIIMIITAMYILFPARLPQFLQRAKPIVLVMLAGYATLYAVTIARL